MSDNIALSHSKSFLVRDIEKDFNQIVGHKRIKNLKCVFIDSVATGHSRILNNEKERSYPYIAIGTKALYENEYPEYASNKGIAWTYRELFHELAHAKEYSDICNALNSGFRLDHRSQEIMMDQMISSVYPQYMSYIYESDHFEKRADLAGITGAMNHFRTARLFRDSGIDFEGLIVRTTNDQAMKWYGQRPVKSVQDAIEKLEDGLMHDRLVTTDSLFDRIDSNLLGDKLRQDESVRERLSGCRTLTGLRHEMIRSICKVDPDTPLKDYIREALPDYSCDIPCDNKFVDFVQGKDDVQDGIGFE